MKINALPLLNGNRQLLGKIAIGHVLMSKGSYYYYYYYYYYVKE